MNILIVSSHPGSKSLNFALKQAFLKGARRKKHKLQIIDLHKERFNPVMSEAELRGKTGPKIKKYQDMLKKADVLVLFYPVRWFSPPAILEGWFEKVFTAGFAFKYKMITKKIGIPIGLLSCKKAIVIETYGGPGWATKLFYGDIAWKRLKYILKCVGMKNFVRYSCFSAPCSTEKTRQKWLKEVEGLGEKLELE